MFENIPILNRFMGKKDEEGVYLYDEWNGKKGRYLKDYCRLYAEDFLEQHPIFSEAILSVNRGVLKVMRRRFLRLFSEFGMRRKVSKGGTPDMDAITENFAALKASRTPDEKVYLSKRKRMMDISVLLLLDLSQSTNAYKQNRRILDVEKQAVLLFGENLNEFDARFQIDGFYSYTRKNVRYLTVKKFTDNWDEARDRIGALEPSGYSRIGPALRHASGLLETENSPHKWILLLSDGKPDDYDGYEGVYGQRDVKQAILEARGQNIGVFLLAIETQAKYRLVEIFGRGAYQILTNPLSLPEALTEFYLRIMTTQGAA